MEGGWESPWEIWGPSFLGKTEGTSLSSPREQPWDCLMQVLRFQFKKMCFCKRMEWANTEGTGADVAGGARHRVGDLWGTSHLRSWDFRLCLVHAGGDGQVNFLLP